MDLTIPGCVKKLTLVIPVVPQKDRTIQDLAKEASAGLLAKIHNAITPAHAAHLALDADRGEPFVQLTPICRLRSDKDNTVRVVNIQIPDKTDIAKSILAGQDVADLVGAPVRIFMGRDYLSAFAQDLLIQPGASADTAYSLYDSSQAYEELFPSLFKGPDGAKHLAASALNQHNRVFVYGDPQREIVTRPMSSKRFARLFPAPDDEL